jgi:hypothetical protein
VVVVAAVVACFPDGCGSTKKKKTNVRRLPCHWPELLLRCCVCSWEPRRASSTLPIEPSPPTVLCVQANFALYFALSVPLFAVTVALRRPTLPAAALPPAPAAITGAGGGATVPTAAQNGIGGGAGGAALATGEVAEKEGGIAAVRGLLANGSVRTLLFQCGVQGLAGPGLTSTFLFIFTKDLGGTSNDMSVLLAVDCLVEVSRSGGGTHEHACTRTRAHTHTHAVTLAHKHTRAPVFLKGATILLS